MISSACILAVALAAAPAEATQPSGTRPGDAQITEWIERMWDPAKHSRELSQQARQDLLEADRRFLIDRLKALYAGSRDADRRTWIVKTLNVLTIVLLTQGQQADPLVTEGHAFCRQVLQDPTTREHEHRFVWLSAANNLKMNRDLGVVDFYIDRMTDPQTSLRFRTARVEAFNALLATTWNPEAFREEARLPALRQEVTEWWQARQPYAEYFFEDGKVYRPYIRVNWLQLGKHPETGQYPPIDYVVQWIATNSAWQVACDEALRQERLSERLEVKAKTLPELLQQIADALGLRLSIDREKRTFTLTKPGG